MPQQAKTFVPKPKTCVQSSKLQGRRKAPLLKIMAWPCTMVKTCFDSQNVFICYWTDLTELLCCGLSDMFPIGPLNPPLVAVCGGLGGRYSLVGESMSLWVGFEVSEDSMSFWALQICLVVTDHAVSSPLAPEACCLAFPPSSWTLALWNCEINRTLYFRSCLSHGVLS